MKKAESRIIKYFIIVTECLECVNWPFTKQYRIKVWNFRREFEHENDSKLSELPKSSFTPFARDIVTKIIEQKPFQKLINFSISYQIAPFPSNRRLFWLLANSTYFPIFQSREPPQKRLQFPSSKQLRWWGRSPRDTRHVELFFMWGFFSSLFDALTRDSSSSSLARSAAVDERWWWFVRWVFLHLCYQ